MNKLDIYICTKSKCTAKRVQIKLWATDAQADSYNGPALLVAIRELIAKKQLDDCVGVHEVMCMSGCPVGPRVDLVSGPRRVMYFQRKVPTGREDLVSWAFIASVEEEIDAYLRVTV
jgi:predicted metal-binding protein